MTVYDDKAIVATGSYRVERVLVNSSCLGRLVTVDIYTPAVVQTHIDLLLVNDGQDLPKMPFAPILSELVDENLVRPVTVVAMHCNEDRRQEYGTAGVPDYLGRGAKAALHSNFVINELLPYLKTVFGVSSFGSTAYAGFSLGGLSALDMVWKHPDIFDTAAIFSGSFWWRSRDLGEGYDDARDRIMHQLIRQGNFAPQLRFFFEAGRLDETADRNKNGIIDSIDDTLDIIKELEAKGYQRWENIHYVEVEEGRHDVATWALAFPHFLCWRYTR